MVPQLLGDPHACLDRKAPAPHRPRRLYREDRTHAGPISRRATSIRRMSASGLTVPVIGDPRAIYARLRLPGGGGWSGMVHDGRRWLLSCSPELFFRLDGTRLTARPMKGTVPADAGPESLLGDPKQRAENLMIVDLIRNDLARVAEPGSVAVPALFEVETYPTVLAMTSTVTADLAAGRDAVDVLEALFPCGSINRRPEDTGDGDYRGTGGRPARALYRLDWRDRPRWRCRFQCHHPHAYDRTGSGQGGYRSWVRGSWRIRRRRANGRNALRKPRS